MNRIAPGVDLGGLRRGLAAIPEPIRRRVGDFHLLAGVDSVAVGINTYEDIGGGRSYRSTAHVLYPEHLNHRPRSERVTTMVLPRRCSEVRTVVHEFGHILHERLALLDHKALPATWYAETNHREAFAEAFTAWVAPPMDEDDWWWTDHYGPARDLLYKEDPATLRLFENLAAL